MHTPGQEAGYIPAARLDDLPPGAARVTQVAARLIALFNVGGVIYATENSCPHSGGPLGKGTLEGETVTCPWHMWAFNVRTGVCEMNPDERIETYPVLVRDGRILVKLAS